MIFRAILRHILHRGCRNCSDPGVEEGAVFGRFSWLHGVGGDVDRERPVFTTGGCSDVFEPDAAPGGGDLFEGSELKATPLRVSEDSCHVAVVIAGLAVNSSNGICLLLQIFLCRDIKNCGDRRVQSVDRGAAVNELNRKVFHVEIMPVQKICLAHWL